MIDATAAYEIISFVDDSSIYNKIQMVQDEYFTTFRTPKGIYL